MTNELRNYLNERKELCENKLDSYNELVAQREIAEQRYLEACNKVEQLGSLEEIVNELNILNGFLSEIEPEQEPTVEFAFPDTSTVGNSSTTLAASLGDTETESID